MHILHTHTHTPNIHIQKNTNTHKKQHTRTHTQKTPTHTLCTYMENLQCPERFQTESDGGVRSQGGRGAVWDELEGQGAG